MTPASSKKKISSHSEVASFGISPSPSVSDLPVEKNGSSKTNKSTSSKKRKSPSLSLLKGQSPAAPFELLQTRPVMGTSSYAMPQSPGRQGSFSNFYAPPNSMASPNSLRMLDGRHEADSPPVASPYASHLHAAGHSYIRSPPHTPTMESLPDTPDEHGPTSLLQPACSTDPTSPPLPSSTPETSGLRSSESLPATPSPCQSEEKPEIAMASPMSSPMPHSYEPPTPRNRADTMPNDRMSLPSLQLDLGEVQRMSAMQQQHPGGYLESYPPSLSPRALVAAMHRPITMNDAVEIVRKEDFLIRMAQLYQLYGCPAHHVDESLRLASEGLGLPSTFKTMPNHVLVTFGTHGANETMFVDTTGGYNLAKLEKIDDIARNCAEGTYVGEGLQEGIQELDRIMMKNDPWALWVTLLAFIFAGGVSTLALFGGSWEDAVFASGLGLFVGIMDQRIEAKITPKLNQLGGFFSTIICAAAVRLIQVYVTDKVAFYPSVLGSMVWLLPGLSLTTSVMELSQGQIVTGTTRMVYAMFKVILYAIGITIGSQLAWAETANLHIHPHVVVSVDLPLVALALFPILALCFGILLNSSFKQLPIQIVVSTVGFAVHMLCEMRCSPEIATTCSAFVIATLGNLYAIYKKRPSIIPVLNGILLLVPGGLGVRGATMSIVGAETGGPFAISVMTVALSIAIGVFVSSVVFSRNRTHELRPLSL